MNLAPEVVYVVKEKDQAKALDLAVAYGQKQGWQLNSVIWQKEEPEGNHHFVISFNEVNSSVKSE
jgi:hypothetical protein